MALQWPTKGILPLRDLDWTWQSVVASAFVVPLFTILAAWSISYVRSPLRRYPGPYLAGWTNLWRFFSARSGKYPIILKKLHDKYGPVVRVGPNLLDLDYPELLKTVYGTNEEWRKTEFYRNNAALVNGKLVFSMFSTSDPAEHARIKRPVAKHYSSSSVLALEPHMDEILGDLCQRLERGFTDGPQSGTNCDLGEWVSYCAWDLITSITVSRAYGYLEHGYDFDHSLRDVDKTIKYLSAVGQMPFLDNFLDKNPIIRLGPPNLGNALNTALNFIINRRMGKDKYFNPEAPDLLHHFIESKTAYPDLVDDGAILGNVLTPLVAGADTTAIAIRAILYFALKEPAVYQRLEKEILAARFSDDKPVPYSAARALPYLEAVVREAMRLHPSIPFPLERYVPAPGLDLPDGSHVPPGTAVATSSYVVCRNATVFGDDAEVFRPERWLREPGETEIAYNDRMRATKSVGDAVFGGGARVCLGRPLALMEVYKMVATLVSRFEIQLADPAREWTVSGRWFFQQKGLICRLRRRGERRQG